MLAQVIAGDLVRDPLVAKGGKQPIKDSRCVVPGDRVLNAFLTKILFDIIEKRQ